MLIKVLTENNTVNPDFPDNKVNSEIQAEHGLSLYIETEKHRVLFDSGQSGIFAENARLLDVDLASVDTAVISHGHYDHGGGLARFLELNQKAPVYITRSAFEPHFNGTAKYIGLNGGLYADPRIIFNEESLKIDDELSLFTCNNREKITEINSFGLNMLENGHFMPDDFRHEQYLMISEKGKRILISGCSHKGIINITEWFKPDILIGGFHFSKLSTETDSGILTGAAETLMNRYKTEFYTGHCTGIEQYSFLKKIMGERLHYISSGSTVII